MDKKAGRPKEKVLNKIPIDKEQLVILITLGAIDEELAKFFKVSVRTIHRWKKDDEFLSLLKEGKNIVDNRIERSLFERAKGYEHNDIHISNYQGKITQTKIKKYYPPDPTSCIFWLKNRKPAEWKDSPAKSDNDFSIPDSIDDLSAVEINELYNKIREKQNQYR